MVSLQFEMKTAFGTKLHAHPNGMAVCLLPENPVVSERAVQPKTGWLAWFPGSVIALA